MTGCRKGGARTEWQQRRAIGERKWHWHWHAYVNHSAAIKKKHACKAVASLNDKHEDDRSNPIKCGTFMWNLGDPGPLCGTFVEPGTF